MARESKKKKKKKRITLEIINLGKDCLSYWVIFRKGKNLKEWIS